MLNFGNILGALMETGLSGSTHKRAQKAFRSGGGLAAGGLADMLGSLGDVGGALSGILGGGKSSGGMLGNVLGEAGGCWAITRIWPWTVWAHWPVP